MDRLRKFTIFALLLLVFLMQLQLPRVSADDLQEAGPVSVTLAAEGIDPEKAPSVDAAAAVLIEEKSGRVLFSLNAEKRRSIASTTKIMTAILAIECGNLNDPVKISKRAAGIRGSNIGLCENETYTLEELLYGLMLNSGNDAAIAIAEHIAGSVEDFAVKMNDKARKIGAQNTVYVTPHGLDAEGQFSTAYDLALITRYALENKEFCKLVSTKKISIPGKTFYNTNELLGVYPGVEGVKTGYTGQAGRCLVTAAAREDMELISVVLGCSSINRRANASRDILDFGFMNYTMHCLVKEGEEVGAIPVVRGKSGRLPVCAAETLELPLTKREADALEKKLNLPDRLIAPVYAGTDEGSLSFEADGMKIGETMLKARRDVNKKGFFDYLGDIFSCWGRMMKEGIFMEP